MRSVVPSGQARLAECADDRQSRLQAGPGSGVISGLGDPEWLYVVSDDWLEAGLPDDAGQPIQLDELELLVAGEAVWVIPDDRLLSAQTWRLPDGSLMLTVDVLDADRALLRSRGVLPNADTHEPIPEVSLDGQSFMLERMRWRGQLGVMILTFRESRLRPPA